MFFCDLDGLPPRVRFGTHAAVALSLWERGVELIETFEVGELLGERRHVRDPRP